MSASSQKFAGDAAKEDSAQSVADKPDNDHHRSSRRKPAKTRKVAAGVNDEAGYDDYLRGEIPDVLLKGLGFAEGRQSGSNSPHSSAPDDIDEHHTADDHDASISTASPVSSPYRRLNVSRGSNGTAGRPIPFNVTPPQPSQPASAPRRRGRPPANSQTPASAARPPATETKVTRTTNIPAGKLLPVTQYNVGPVLEKMLAATQSMGMLLASLNDDLRRTSMPFVPTSDQQRKRREAASKLWRAFIAYKKSFEDIEKYTKTTSVSTQPSTAIIPTMNIPTNFPSGKQSTAASVAAQEPQNKVSPSRAARKQSNPKAVAETVIVVNLSDLSSESDDELPSAQKKQRLGIASTAAEIDRVDQLKLRCTSNIESEPVTTAGEIVDRVNSVKQAEGEGSTSSSSSGSGSNGRITTASKTEVFSALRFEPLFDVSVVNNPDN